jgi:hypothetical protein
MCNRQVCVHQLCARGFRTGHSKASAAQRCNAQVQERPRTQEPTRLCSPLPSQLTLPRPPKKPRMVYYGVQHRHAGAPTRSAVSRPHGLLERCTCQVDSCRSVNQFLESLFLLNIVNSCGLHRPFNEAASCKQSLPTGASCACCQSTSRASLLHHDIECAVDALLSVCCAVVAV